MESSHDFESALEIFRKNAENARRAYFDVHEYTHATPNVEIAKGGRKYVKFLSTESNPRTGEPQGQTFVHSFIEKETGDIFKPATFKAPAKHARGNIWENAGADSLNDTGGIRYMR